MHLTIPLWELTRRSDTGNCEWRTYLRSQHGGWSGIRTCDPSHLSVVRYLQDLTGWWCHPPASCTLVERPLMVRDCLLVGKFPLISQLASISRGHSTIRHPWTRWVAVIALQNPNMMPVWAKLSILAWYIHSYGIYVAPFQDNYWKALQISRPGQTGKSWIIFKRSQTGPAGELQPVREDTNSK